MFRLIPLVLWLIAALTAIGCSGTSQVDLGRIILSGRDGWQYPERVIEALAIGPGDRVAEIGAGSGYWLPWLVEAVGPDGRVYLVEVEPDLVAKLEKRIAREGHPNVEVILGTYADPGLPKRGIDLAMTCLTYHHIEDRIDYFARLQSNLASGGRVAHLDDRPDSPAPISWFQSSGHWSESEDVVSEMTHAGYALSEAFDFLPAQSFQIFRPDDAHAQRNP